MGVCLACKCSKYYDALCYFGLPHAFCLDLCLTLSCLTLSIKHSCLRVCSLFISSPISQPSMIDGSLFLLVLKAAIVPSEECGEFRLCLESTRLCKQQ